MRTMDLIGEDRILQLVMDDVAREKRHVIVRRVARPRIFMQKFIFSRI